MAGVSQHGMATASGLNDYDYETLSSLSMGHKQLNQVQTVNKIPIPPEILEHFKRKFANNEYLFYDNIHLLMQT